VANNPSALGESPVDQFDRIKNSKVFQAGGFLETLNLFLFHCAIGPYLNWSFGAWLNFVNFVDGPNRLS